MLGTVRSDLRQPAPGHRTPQTPEGVLGDQRASLLTLAREIHDTAIQRLCGVSLLLSGDVELSGEHQAVCRAEVASALLELREAIQTSLTSQESFARLSSERGLANLRSRHAPERTLEVVAAGALREDLGDGEARGPDESPEPGATTRGSRKCDGGARRFHRSSVPRALHDGNKSRSRLRQAHR